MCCAPLPEELLVRGVQLVVNHHDRKGDGKRRGAKGLDDLYGSRWLGAGAGSVLYIAGEPGSDEVEMHHLKVPMDRVGPLALRHDHAAGRTTIAGAIPSPRPVRRAGGGKDDALDFLKQQATPVGTTAVARHLGVTDSLARRYLRELKAEKRADSKRVGTAAEAEWWAT